MLCLGLIQTRTPACQLAALDALEPMVRKAAADGAQLILTPEGSNVLEQRRDRREAVIVDQDKDVVVLGLRRLADELGVWILIGSAIVKSGRTGDHRAANRSLLVDPTGAIVSTYDKMHVFDVSLPNGEDYRESATIRPGEIAVVAPTPWGGLGLTICYDVRFSYLHRSLAQAGASLIAVPAAFTVPTGEAHWEVLLRARAIETGAFVLAPAQGGLHEDGRRTWGHSIVIGPWGEVIARLDHDEPGILMANLDLEAVVRARASIPSLTHDRSYGNPKASRMDCSGPAPARSPET
jgi:predicted amidohydrolase